MLIRVLIMLIMVLLMLITVLIMLIRVLIMLIMVRLMLIMVLIMRIRVLIMLIRVAERSKLNGPKAPEPTRRSGRATAAHRLRTSAHDLVPFACLPGGRQQAR